MPSLVQRRPNTAICLKWVKTEQGWGFWPDGYSLHLTYADLRSFITQRLPEDPNHLPAIYSRPVGHPSLCHIDAQRHQQLTENNGSYHYADCDYPQTHDGQDWKVV